MRKPNGLGTKRVVTLSIALCAAVGVFAIAGCKQWTRMEDNQIKLQAMVAANARQLAIISSQVHTGQGKLNESIRDLDQNTQEVASGVRVVQDEQLQLHEALVAGNDGLNKRITRLADDQHSLQGSLTHVADVTGRTASDLTALAGEHAALHEMVRANQRELTKSIGAVAGDQQRVQTGITHLQQTHEGLASDVAALAGKQDAMQQTLDANHEDLTTRIAGLSENQQTLRAGINTLDGKADQAALDFVAATSSLQETLRINRDVLTGQMAAGLQNQQALQANIQDIGAKTGGLAADIGQVSARQTKLHETLKNNHDTIITAMAAAQDTLHQTLRSHNEAASAQAADLSQNQAALQTQLDTLTATASQTALDIIALDSRQATLLQSVRAGNEATAAQVGSLAENQQALKTGISDLAGKTNRVSADIATMAAGHDTVQRTLVERSDEINARVALLAERQQTLASNLDILVATTGQTALDMLTLADGQADVQQNVRAGNDALAARMTTLADNQRQIQSNLDTVTATTGQASLDVIALGKGQAQLEQALQANRQDLAGGLAAIARDQQNWLQQFEATQAKAQAVGESVAALEQQIAKLQGTLQTNVEDVTTRLSTDDQQRAQFEAQVSRDMQAMIDLVTQLHQVQTSLQEQMTQVHKSTQTQAENIKAALEQMKGTPNANDGVWETQPSAAELKVSDAGKRLEAPVTQGAE